MKKEIRNDTGTDMDLLRFITIGSVDDGKSTLIGRLMYDTKSIFEDQLRAIEESSERRGDEHVNLALLTDGLKAEREQGITIDVAYRYFATPKRKFIMADAPGHIQYTRNMVTGASTAQLAIILIDARTGIVEQTRRHSHVVSLLGIRHVLVAINKMDLVGFEEDTFDRIRREYLEFAESLSLHDIRFVPISALNGDNVVDPSRSMPWYKGETVLGTLESVEVSSDHNHNMEDGRFPIQRVIRPQSAEHPDFRGYAGRIDGGTFKPGDSVVILPSGTLTRIDKIYSYKTELEEAWPSMSVTFTLADDVDASRGDMIVQAGSLPSVSQDINLDITWLNDRPLNLSRKYLLRHTTRETPVLVKGVEHKTDVHESRPVTGDFTVSKNDIARLRIKTADPIFFDPYERNRATGSVILVDEFTNETVAAGMIR